MVYPIPLPPSPQDPFPAKCEQNIVKHASNHNNMRFARALEPPQPHLGVILDLSSRFTVFFKNDFAPLERNAHFRPKNVKSIVFLRGPFTKYAFLR